MHLITAEAALCVSPVSKHGSWWLILTLGDADRRVISIQRFCFVRLPADRARRVFTPAVHAQKRCVCTGRLAQQLQQQIDSIAADSGAPVFEPHVTLIGGVHRPEAEVLSVAADLAARLQVSVAPWF